MGSLPPATKRVGNRGMTDCPGCYADFENMRRKVYDCGDNCGEAIFVPVCVKCHRFVKADDHIVVNEESGLKNAPNATCSQCGRTKMHFEGFF